MMNCDKGYGNHCFNCTEAKDHLHVVGFGAGMDAEMIEEFGERAIAIACPHQERYLILKLTKDQVKELSGEKLEEITEEAANSSLITVRETILYITEHSNEIETKEVDPYRGV